MVKIDIISGFLGAGKTTFIQRLLKTSLAKEKVVLIENEYGEVSVDTDFLSESKIEIKELSQGCICCSLVGDFSKSLNEVIHTFNPDRILIEPSGVGKLSDIVKAVIDAGLEDGINSLVCMVDAKKAKMYEKNFGEFFIDQIEHAQTVILSRTDISKEDMVTGAVEIIRKHNPNCVIVTTPIKDLADEELLKAYEGFDVNLLAELHKEDDECECGHHHHDDDDECECGHHHHDDDDECECGHHHHDDDECECGHHHHHHADEVFTSVGIETVKKYDIEALKALLNKMAFGEYGQIVRAKGIIQGMDNVWYAFNLTPEEVEINKTVAIPMGKIVVIGAHIDSAEIKKLF